MDISPLFVFRLPCVISSGSGRKLEIEGNANETVTEEFLAGKQVGRDMVIICCMLPAHSPEYPPF